MSAPISLFGKMTAFIRPYLDQLPNCGYRKKSGELFSPAWLRSGILSKVATYGADVIHLHWVNAGYLSIGEIGKLPRPIVWTFHDMWPLTGGCHYDSGCGSFVTGCGGCKALGSLNSHDLSCSLFKKKLRMWKEQQVTVVAPSHWLANCAGLSPVFQNSRIEVIPNGLDLKVFRPVDKKVARELLGVPLDEPLILFGAIGATSDKRKGFSLLQKALQVFCGKFSATEVSILLFGVNDGGHSDFEMKTYYLGYLYDDISLVLAYSAADVMVVPSYQEAFGQTASESLACGTPVVAFDVTGLKDIVDHKVCGYLAEPYNPEDLATGIEWVLAKTARGKHLSQMARKRAEQEFDIEKVADHRQVYQSVLS